MSLISAIFTEVLHQILNVGLICDYDSGYLTDLQVLFPLWCF